MQHTIQEGESLSSIAHKYGFRDWHAIYDHDKNAAFRKEHPDPARLTAGGSLFIPPKKSSEAATTTGSTLKFVAKKVPGVRNLKFDPKEGTFRELKSTRISGETDLPDGTELPLRFHARGRDDVALPSLTVTVSAKKFAADYPLAEVYALPGLYALEIDGHATHGGAGNCAHLKLRDARCVAEGVKIFASEADAKEADAKEGRPRDAHNLLQVVADNRITWKCSPFEVLKPLAEVAAQVAGRTSPGPSPKRKRGKGKRERSRTRRALQEAQARAADAQALADEELPDFGLSIAYVRAGGAAEIVPTLALSQPCQKSHHLDLSGGRSAALSPKGEKVKLEFKGQAHTPISAAPPTRYTLEGQGCQPDKKKTQVEVFSPESLLIAFNIEHEIKSTSMEARAAGFQKYLEGVVSTFKFIGVKVEPSLKAEGSFSLFAGFREEGDDWRVYYAEEFAIELGATAEMTARFSLVKTTLKVPPLLTDLITNYLGDLYLKVGVKGGLKLKGKVDKRTYSKDAASASRDTGEVELTGNLSFPIEAGAETGPKLREWAYAALSGKVEPAFTVGGKLEISAEEITLRPTGRVEACDLAIGLHLKASGLMRWFETEGEARQRKQKDPPKDEDDAKPQYEWKWTLWKEWEPDCLKKAKWVIYDAKKDKPGGT